MSDNLHIVLIEFDGAQPPSRYYRRIHGLSFKVRGDKEVGPLARRDTGKGVIFQEGAVIAASESLARTIAMIATDEGAVNVSIGRVKLDEHFFRTRQDEAILARIERTMGKRGKKPPAQPWVIACTECVQTNAVNHHAPVNCPNCGGLLIHIRPGQPQRFRDPGGDVFDVWLCSRFAGPHWEPVEFDPAAPLPPAEVELLNDRERQAAALIAASPVLEKLRQMPRDVALAFLDAMLVNRAYRDKEARLAARIEAATAFFKRDGNPAAFRLNEPAQPDLADATAVLGAEMVATWLLHPGLN